MSITICLAAKTLYYPAGGGHLWVYLNWALGFQANKCNVIWLEAIDTSFSWEVNSNYISQLKNKLAAYNLHNCVAIRSLDGSPLKEGNLFDCIGIHSAAQQADLLLNQDYSMPASVLNLFKRTALLDIDPGLLQIWAEEKYITIQSHDCYFTIGETVGRTDSLFSDCGLSWIYTPPCVSLEHWPVKSPSEIAKFNSITHWSSEEWVDYNGHLYKNDKRSGYLPFLALPKLSTAPLELALFLDEGEDKERALLESYGWSVKHSHSVASTPDDYQNYIQGSLGEFSCVKPSCVRLQNGWISDRTICYLASGKPAIVQHTGSSSFLPDRAGLLRFHDLKEAISCLEEVASDYKKHSSFARTLAEEYFDAKKVTKDLLERALN